MEKVTKWQPIATASASAELELSICDKGVDWEMQARDIREGSGWRDVRANRFFCLSRGIGAIGRASDKQPPTSISRTSRDAARQPIRLTRDEARRIAADH